MAMTTIRSTYALDVETMQVVKRIAHKWKLSKSEALRRAIRAAEGRRPRAPNDALRALDRLQRSLRLTSCEGEGVGEAGSSGPRGVGHAQRAARPMIYPHTGFFIVDGQAVQPSATPAWP